MFSESSGDSMCGCLPKKTRVQRRTRQLRVASPQNHTVSKKKQKKPLAHLSPYILCLFLLGLPPGVISLVRPVSSNSFISALLSAFGSIATSIVFDLSLRAPLSTFVLLPVRRFSVAAGGVIAPGGGWTGGVLRWVVFLNRLTCELEELATSSAAPISMLIKM